MGSFTRLVIIALVVLGHAALFRLALAPPRPASQPAQAASAPERRQPDAASPREPLGSQARHGEAAGAPDLATLESLLDGRLDAGDGADAGAGAPWPSRRDDGVTDAHLLPGEHGAVLALEAGTGAAASRDLAERIAATAPTSSLLLVRPLAPAPEPRANWAMALVGEGADAELIAGLGLGPGRSHEDIAADAFAYSPSADRWRSLPAPPVPGGRLAAAAVSLGGELLLIGGYTVAADGSEASTPEVLAFEPGTERWRELTRMPVPVDDTVAMAWRGRWLVLVSGWSQDRNVADVQLFDLRERRWTAGTPWPGTPVFGHAGALAGDRMVVCDGVSARRGADGRNRFALEHACWLGELDPADPGSIDWRELPPHPGPPVYRAAASATAARDGVIFAGGGTRAYNYDGIGYDGQPATASAAVFSWDFAGDGWRRHPDLPVASMDHRALVEHQGEYLLVGGMRDPQRVTAEGIGFRLPLPRR